MQSYAGKYIPAIGYKIHTSNANNPLLQINLQGLAIGDGLCDPENVSIKEFSVLIVRLKLLLNYCKWMALKYGACLGTVKLYEIHLYNIQCLI